MQAFEAVARLGSVGAAANELSVSPGAVSQQLRKIEEALGLEVLERRGNGLALTAAGRLYADELAPAFEQLRGAHGKLLRSQSKSPLVLSCLSSVASRWIGPQLFDWQAAHPGTRVRLIGAEAEPQLSGGEVDFRISYGNAALGFKQRSRLFTDAVVPACAPALLAAHPVRVPADVLALPRIGIEWHAAHGALPGWDEWAERIGAGTRESADDLTFSLSSAAIDAAVNGRGVVLAQVALIGDDLVSGRLVAPFDLRLPLPHDYFLAWDPAALQKPRGTEFRDWVTSLGQRQVEVSGRPLAVAAAPKAGMGLRHPGPRR